MPQDYMQRSVRPVSRRGAIDVARENAARLAEQRRRATQGGTSPLRQGDNSVPMARPGSYPQTQMPNATRPQQTYSGSVPSMPPAAARPSPGVNVPLPPSVYPDFLDNRPPMGQTNEVLKANRSAARIGKAADTLQARREGRPARATIVPRNDPRMSSPENQQALAVLDQMAVDRREGDAARSRARAAFRAVQDGYANMTGGNSSLYDSTAVGNRSAVMAPARPGQMTTQQALDTAFDVRDSGIRGRGPYGGRPTYTQPGGMMGREAALAAPGALAPTTQMRAEAANAEADARRRARNAAAGRSPEDMGTRAGIGADYDGDGTISDNEMAQVEARMRERRAEREGFPTTREEKAQAFQAQRDRRRDRAQRAQEIMSLRSQMANTTTGRQAVGMGGNGFSPEMQFATTYQYNRPSLGQAAAMLDASRRRQQVADRAAEQQAFTNQLAVVTAMPEGPERTQALSRLQSQMQPSSGEVAGSQPNPNTREGRDVIRQTENEYTEFLDSLGEQGMNQTIGEISNPPEGITSVQQLLDSGLRPSDIMDAMESRLNTISTNDSRATLQAIIDSPESSEQDRARAREIMQRSNPGGLQYEARSRALGF